MTSPRPEEMTTLARTMDWLMAREMAARAEAWDEAAEATAEWMANNPSPAGVPIDPPRNPYRATKETP